MTNFINIKRSSSNDLVAGRCSGPNSGCRKHPKHKQSPGVCSLCLRDKLARLSTASRGIAAVAASCTSSSSVSSYHSSSSVSSCASPVMYRYGFTTSFLSSGSKNALMGKSRSLASVRRSAKRNSGDENDKDEEKMRISGGFLSRFIFPRSKRKDLHAHQAKGLLI